VTAAGPAAPGQSSRLRLRLWLFDCDKHGARLLELDESVHVLTAAERGRASRLTDPLVRRRWMCARIALRRALGARTSAAFELRDFDVTAHGRPYLSAMGPNFSISHAGPYVLTAVCDGAIGADIEQIASRKISPQRRQRLEAFAEQLGGPLDADGDAEMRFIQAWCRIEASAKAEGCGVGRLLTRAGLMGPAAHERPAAAAAGSESAIKPAAALMRAADLDVVNLAPGFAAAVAGPPETVAGWGHLSVEDGGALLTGLR
jgi:4'-phosphopantetheinyl transferase